MSKEGMDDGPCALQFLAPNVEEVQRLVAVLALGMVRAMTTGLVTPAFACHRLFGPALIAKLRACGACPDLIYAVDLASELEQVEQIVPHAFADSLSDVERRFTELVARFSPGEIQGEKWLDVAPPRVERP